MKPVNGITTHPPAWALRGVVVKPLVVSPERATSDHHFRGAIAACRPASRSGDDHRVS
jgi:hypothetical protein